MAQLIYRHCADAPSKPSPHPHKLITQGPSAMCMSAAARYASMSSPGRMVIAKPACIQHRSSRSGATPILSHTTLGGWETADRTIHALWRRYARTVTDRYTMERTVAV